MQIRNRNVVRNSDGRLDRHGPQHAIAHPRPRRHGAGGRTASTYGSRLLRRRRRQGQARPAPRRVGSLHPPGPDRGRRHRRVRGSGRRVSPCQETTDETTGITKRVVIDWRANAARQRPQAGAHRPRRQGRQGRRRSARGGDARYLLSVDAILSVEPGAEVKAGDVLARIPMESAKTRDITGGLPRVAELFEARRPKDHAIIAEIDGTIHFGRDYKNKRRDHHRAARGRRRAGRVPDPEGQAVPSPGRRHHREGRLHRRRQPGPARHPGDQGHRGAGRLPRQRDPGGLPAAGRDDQRQAHRGDRSPDAAEGRDHRPGDTDMLPGRADRPARPR